MENYLKPAITVPFANLFPDPNNPRLALDDVPGYENATALFSEERRREILEEIGGEAYGVKELLDAIIGQGWMPIDNILTWDHPTDNTDHHVVVEGNRRIVALSLLRTVELDKAKKKLARMEKKAASYSKKDLEDARDLVARIEQIVADTEELTVVPLDADSPAELLRKLPRVLAVRHITGAKEWGNYAEDLWLLARFEHLFAEKHGDDADLFWDAAMIKSVANEASLSDVSTKRQLKAAKWFSHFMAEWEDELPDGESFGKSDYYLFENISKKPWVRNKLSIGDDDMAIPEVGETALFNWVFKMVRTKKADTNPNVFYRHENIVLWDRIHAYDVENGTDFAERFDVENPDDAPTMHEVEAKYLTHKANKKPHALLNDLLSQLKKVSAEQLAADGTFLRAQFVQSRDMADKFIKMIDASGS